MNSPFHRSPGEDGALPKRRRAIRASLILLPLVICAAASLLMTSGRRLPYHDRFAEGKLEEWSVFGGSWQTVGSVLSNNSDDAGSKLVTGSESLEDYVINADVSLTSSLGDTGIMVRVTNPEVGTNAFNGYYVGMRLPDQLLLGKMDYGYRPLRGVPIADGVKPYDWYHLTVLVRGCEISAAAYDARGNEIAATSFVDGNDCDRQGAFGLRSFAAGGRWRHVYVEAVR